MLLSIAGMSILRVRTRTGLFIPMVSRLHGIKPEVYNEGTHLVVRLSNFSLYKLSNRHIFVKIPWFESPILFDIRAKPRNIASLTGTKGQYILSNGANSPAHPNC